MRASARFGLIGQQDLPRVRAYFVDRGPYLGTAALAGDQDLMALFNPGVWDAAHAPPRAAGNSFADIGAFDLATRLPDDLLVRTDRATMGASIEARVPFLDHDVVEMVLRLPQGLRARMGVSKVLPRMLACRWRVPAATILHRKIGFQLPLGAWIRGPLSGFWQGVFDQRVVPGLNYEQVRRLHEAHARGVGQFEEILWRVAALEYWYRHHITGDVLTTQPHSEDAISCAL
jgi:asparagine synthase (glutamine-hydrolysing)